MAMMYKHRPLSVIMLLLAAALLFSGADASLKKITVDPDRRANTPKKTQQQQQFMAAALLSGAAASPISKIALDPDHRAHTPKKTLQGTLFSKPRTRLGATAGHHHHQHSEQQSIFSRDSLARRQQQEERNLADEPVQSCLPKFSDGSCRPTELYTGVCYPLTEKKSSEWCYEEERGEICCSTEARDCCQPTAAGIAVFSVVVAAIVILITLASCACCSCCPLYKKLCCSPGGCCRRDGQSGADSGPSASAPIPEQSSALAASNTTDGAKVY